MFASQRLSELSDTSSSEPRRAKVDFLRDEDQHKKGASLSDPRPLRSRIPRPILLPKQAWKHPPSFLPDQVGLSVASQADIHGQEKQLRSTLSLEFFQHSQSKPRFRSPSSQTALRPAIIHADQAQQPKTDVKFKPWCHSCKPLPEEPPVARYKNVRPTGENACADERHAIPDPFRHSSAEALCKGNVGTLFAEIRRLKHELDVKNEVCFTSLQKRFLFFRFDITMWC